MRAASWASVRPSNSTLNRSCRRSIERVVHVGFLLPRLQPLRHIGIARCLSQRTLIGLDGLIEIALAIQDFAEQERGGRDSRVHLQRSLQLQLASALRSCSCAATLAPNSNTGCVGTLGECIGKEFGRARRITPVETPFPPGLIEFDGRRLRRDRRRDVQRQQTHDDSTQL